jgi:hypothetical protein
MMSLEALLSSLLVLSALALTLQTPPASHPLLEFSAYQQLQDRAAAIVELQTLPTSLARASTPPDLATTLSTLTPLSDAYCYRAVWSDAPDAPAFSDAWECPDEFSRAPPTIRSIQLGAWKDGHLQFLNLTQFEHP